MIKISATFNDPIFEHCLPSDTNNTRCLKVFLFPVVADLCMRTASPTGSTLRVLPSQWTGHVVELFWLLRKLGTPSLAVFVKRPSSAQGSWYYIHKRPLTVTGNQRLSINRPTKRGKKEVSIWWILSMWKRDGRPFTGVSTNSWKRAT
jgi:hypothetical protein